MDIVEPVSSQPGTSSKIQFCFLDEQLEYHRDLIDSIRIFKAGYFQFCDAALHAASRRRSDKRIIFVSMKFEGPVFKAVKAVTKAILGPPAVIAFACSPYPEIPPINRPLYSLIMKGTTLVLDGFTNTVAAKLIKQIQSLGGSVLKRLTDSSISRHRPSHLVSYSSLSNCYQLAIRNGMIVVSQKWLTEIWRRRDEKDLNIATDITPHFLLQGPNFFCNICVFLLGFSQSELMQWTSAIICAGGAVDKEISASTNLIVLNDSCCPLSLQLMRDNSGIRTFRFSYQDEELLFDVQPNQDVVDAGFLRTSFTNGICSPVTDFDVLRNVGISHRNDRRKRRLSLESTFESEVLLSPKRQHLPPSHPVMSCRFSSPSAKLQFLAFHSPNPVDIPDIEKIAEIAKECLPLASERWYRVTELLNTERNYVQILSSLWDNLIVPLRNRCGDENALLEFPQIHMIFRNLFDICKLHRSIIQELEKATIPWEENCQIGTILAKHAPAFIETYSTFINSYESSKLALEQCMSEKADFQSFVRSVMNLPEFGRGSLTDVLIRPIQRLPSILLLLRELEKRTTRNHPDYQGIQLAVAGMERVLQNLNQSKRNSEWDGPSGSDSHLVQENQPRHDLSQVQFRPRKIASANQAWEKARKLSSKTTGRLSKVFSLGTKSSGLKRVASQAFLHAAKNLKNNPDFENS